VSLPTPKVIIIFYETKSVGGLISSKLTSSKVIMQTILANCISFSTHKDPHTEAITYNFKNQTYFRTNAPKILKNTIEERKIQHY
jgi:hypothetical protein